MYNISVNVLQRIQTIRNFLQQQHLPAVFISSRENIFYLTNYQGFTDEGRDAFILITPTQQFLFTHALYIDEVTGILPQFAVKQITSYKTFPDQLSQLLQQEKIQQLGFEENDLTYAEYQLFHKGISPFSPISLRTLRIHKDDAEISLLQKACTITDIAFKEIQKYLKPGVAEEEIAHHITLSFCQQYASNAFSPVVAFGKNAAVAHHLPDQTKLQEKDTILIDFGAQYEKYCADMSRTLFIGKVSPNEEKAYQAVNNALEAVYEKLEKDYAKNGEVKVSELDVIARSIVTKAGFSEYPHALGHGVGLQFHESPTLHSKSPDVLTNGMVFTLEPGIYLPGAMGIRIEDVVALTDKGVVILTSSPKELIVL